jgi:hypothetical protein
MRRLDRPLRIGAAEALGNALGRGSRDGQEGRGNRPSGRRAGPVRFPSPPGHSARSFTRPPAEKGIALVLGKIAAKTGDNHGAGLLVGAHNLPKVLRIELL